MITGTNHKVAGLALASMAMLTLAGCSMGTSTGPTMEPTPTTPVMESPMPTEEPSTRDMSDPAYANLVGAGCEMYDMEVPDGDGSIIGMSQDPVAVAASNNPMLTMLTAAVSGQINPDVNLVDTLNGAEFTVFAPVDDAFAFLPVETVSSLESPEGAEMLESVLTYHVVPGQVAPDAIAGTHTTVQGEEVTVSGEGDDLMVNDATVICGGVQTSNATIYLIDTVLMPPSTVTEEQ